MSFVGHVAIDVKTLRINSGCSLEKELIEFLCMNPWTVSYLSIKQVDSSHIFMCGPLAWDTKYILWTTNESLTLANLVEDLWIPNILNHILYMAYESLLLIGQPY